MNEAKLQIGWAKADVTPDRPVALRGQFHVRISRGVLDPLYVTALVIAAEDQPDHVVMVSLDAVNVSNVLRDEIRAQAGREIKGLNPQNIFINATHTHTAPGQLVAPGRGWHLDTSAVAMPAAEVNALITGRTIEAIKQAWSSRRPGYFGHGVAPAVVGSNRRACYRDGSSAMYGDTTRDDFTHNEGDCDHSVNLLYTYDAEKQLTGVVANIACPSQVSEHLYEVSADFWHDVREALAERLGPDVFVLPQCSAAGDQSPHIEMNPSAHKRMLQLKYSETDIRNAWRREIAARILQAVEEALPLAGQDMHDRAILKSQCLQLTLPFWQLTQGHLDEAAAGIKECQARLDKLPVDVAGMEYSRTYAYLRYYQRVFEAHKQRTAEPGFITEVNLVRLGPVAFATNQFELLLDFGQRIKGRAHALQTFVVQLTGEGYYLPPERACRGGYGATPMNGPVGPEGGDELVEQTVRGLNQMFPENLNSFKDRF